MKIAFFSECYLPWQNGAVTSIVSLRESLRSMGHTVYLFAPGDGRVEPEEDVFRLKELSFPEHPYHYAHPFPRIGIDFAALGVEVVHSQHPFSVGRLGARLARKHRLPLVHTVHSDYGLMARHASTRIFRTIGPPVCQAVQQRYCEKVDCIIAPSEYTAASLRQIGVNTRVEIVPSGVRPLKTSPGARARLRKQLGIGDEPVLLYAGRLCPTKRIDVLLQSLPLLRNKNFRLVVAGDGQCRWELEEMARYHGMHRRVQFVGEQAHETIGD